MIQRKLRRSQRQGIITVVVAVSLIAIFAIIAVAIDGGRMLDRRRQVEAVADAASRAAAIELFDAATSNKPGINPGTAIASALRTAADNGFANDGQNCIVTVNCPPVSGDYAGRDGYVEVIITSRQARSFSRIFGTDPLTAVGRSVAAGTLAPTSASVLVLDPRKKNALALGKGTSTLKVFGDIMVNSKANSPISIAKSAQIEADNVVLSGSLPKKHAQAIQSRIQGELHTRMPATENPLQDTPIPSKGPNRKLSDYRTVEDGVETFRLQPGRYTETWKFDNNDVVHLEPGTYYLDGKGMQIKESANIEGYGVTIYSAGKKEVRIESSGSITLTPPDSGPLAGIVLMQDPAAKGKITFKKDLNLDISGTIYAPNSLVRFQKTDAELGDDDDDESAWDEIGTDLEDQGPPGDEAPSEGVMGASIIARMLKIDKHSTVTLNGANIRTRRPLLSVVE